MRDQKFGNVWESALNKLFYENAKKYQLSYSHPEINKWNLWMQSALTLHFRTYSGKMIPCLVGAKKETLEHFYLSNLAQIDSWVKKDIQ